MGLELDIDLLFKVSDFLVGPHVADFVFPVFLEPWNIVKVGRLGDCFVQSVYYEDVDSALGAAGVVFGGMSLVPRPGWVDTPFVRESGCAPSIVLIESEDLPVFQDGKVLVIDSVQLLEREKKKEKRKKD